MATKWLIGIIMVYVIGGIVCLVAEYLAFQSSSSTYITQEATNNLYSLINSVEGISFTNPLTALTDILVNIWTITQVLFRILIWDFSFFNASGYEIIKYVVFWPLSIGFFVSFILAVRGTSSA